MVVARNTAATCRILSLLAMLVVSSHGFAPSPSCCRQPHTKTRIPNNCLKNDADKVTLFLRDQSTRLQVSSSSSSGTRTSPRWKFWKRIGSNNKLNCNGGRKRKTNASCRRKLALSFKNMRWIPGMAFFLATLLLPRLPALAGGAMGGSIEAPVAPMERYAWTAFRLVLRCSNEMNLFSLFSFLLLPNVTTTSQKPAYYPVGLVVCHVCGTRLAACLRDCHHHGMYHRNSSPRFVWIHRAMHLHMQFNHSINQIMHSLEPSNV